MAKGKINVSVENIFPLIKKFLYSDQEIFLRELISNATDATLKLKHLSNIGEFKEGFGNPIIEVKIDKNNNKSDALNDIYKVLRPGEAPSLEIAQEIFDWMKKIANYENDTNIIAGEQKDKFFTDANLFLTNSAFKEKRVVVFKNAYPIALSGMQFASTLNDNEPIIASVTLNFESYSFETVT